MTIAISQLTPEHFADAVPGLIDLLQDTIDGGAAVGFINENSSRTVKQFWQHHIPALLTQGDRLLYVARQQSKIVGTVQLIVGTPANQPHRVEIAKMMVHRNARRRGVGRALMECALHTACEMGKKLVTLDTRSGDPAQSLYAALGFVVAGEIPDYALDTDGKTLHATTYMYKRLGQT